MGDIYRDTLLFVVGCLCFFFTKERLLKILKGRYEVFKVLFNGGVYYFHSLIFSVCDYDFIY